MAKEEISQERINELMKLIEFKGYLPVTGATQKAITISNLQIKRLELLAELFDDSFSGACSLAIMLGLEVYEQKTIDSWYAAKAQEPEAEELPF